MRQRQQCPQILLFAETQSAYGALPSYLQIIVSLKHSPFITAEQNAPVLADSMIPNGFSKLKNASTRFVFPLISTMTLFSLTSTIRAPNWVASVFTLCKCWCLSLNASAGVKGGGIFSAPCPACPCTGLCEFEPAECPPDDDAPPPEDPAPEDSNCSASATSCSNVRDLSSSVASGSGTGCWCECGEERGSWEGPPRSWASR